MGGWLGWCILLDTVIVAVVFVVAGVTVLVVVIVLVDWTTDVGIVVVTWIVARYRIASLVRLSPFVSFW